MTEISTLPPPTNGAAPTDLLPLVRPGAGGAPALPFALPISGIRQLFASGANVTIGQTGTIAVPDVSEAMVIAAGATAPRLTSVRAADTPNVLDFNGIDPTGQNDSTAALTAWAAEVSSSGRSSARIARGTYSVSGTITINLPQGSGLHLYGDGANASVLRFDQAGGLAVNVASSLDGIDVQGVVTVSDLALAANVANAGTALSITGPVMAGQRSVPGARVDNVYVDSWLTTANQCWTNGITITDSANASIQRCLVNLRNSGGKAFRLVYNSNPVTDCVVRDCWVFFTGATGVGLSAEGWVEGLHLIDSTFVAVGTGLSAAAGTGVTRPLVFVRGCYFLAYNPIILDRYDFITIISSNFSIGDLSANNYNCISILNTESASTTGLDSKYIVITGNGFNGYDVEGGSNDIGINIANGSQGVISDNTFCSLKTDIFLGADTQNIVVKPNIHDYEGIARVTNQSTQNVVQTDEDAASALGNFAYNGWFDLWQRGTSSTAAAYLADRWIPNVKGGSGGSFTQEQVLDAPNTQSHYAFELIQNSAAYTGASFYSVQQRFETRDARRMAGRQLTLSFWYKSNLVGTHNARFAICDGAQANILASSVASFPVAASGTWQLQIVNFGLITPTANWTASDPNLGATLDIGFLCGTGSGGATTLAVGQYFELAQVRLLAGRIQSTMPAPDPGIELRRCERYFEQTYPFGTVAGATGVQSSALSYNVGAIAYGTACWKFETRKRATPNVMFYSPATGASNMMLQSDVGAGTSGDVSVGNVAISDGQTSAEAQSTIVRSSRAYLYVHATADAEL